LISLDDLSEQRLVGVWSILEKVVIGNGERDLTDRRVGPRLLHIEQQ
jgi:hypothetical protein